MAKPALTKWAIKFVFVATKDETMCFCVDYCGLNAGTVQDSYPILHRYECIDSLEDAQKFPIINGNSQYLQIEMDDKVVEKAAFVTNHALLKYFRMLFGIKNNPAKFQRRVNFVQESVNWQHAIVCIDETTIFSKQRKSSCNV